MRLIIVIPVYNEGPVIRGLIKSLPKKIRGIREILVVAVNDGSADNSAAEIKKSGAILVSHPFNMGYGSTTVTGFEAAKLLDADIVVTFDGDGQHSPGDISKIVRPIVEKKADLVMGSRQLRQKEMPWYKKIGITGLGVITFILSRKWTNDSQSGFKAFSRKAIDSLQFELLGYEFASEIIMEAAAKNLRIKEIPIKIIYSEHSKRKGQPIINGINIVAKLIFKKITG